MPACSHVHVCTTNTYETAGIYRQVFWILELQGRIASDAKHLLAPTVMRIKRKLGNRNIP